MPAWGNGQRENAFEGRKRKQLHSETPEISLKAQVARDNLKEKEGFNGHPPWGASGTTVTRQGRLN